MKRLLVPALVLFATASLAGAPADQPLHMAANRAFEPGEHLAIVSLYANEGDDTPLAVETHRVTVDAHGGFSATFQNLAAFGDSRQRWIGVRLLPGTEGPRRRVAASSRPIRVLVVPLAAITADGYVESTVDGFRFPGGQVFNGFGTPASVGTSNAGGVASTISRSDHVHAHGNQAGGSLHSDATVSVSGFMSAADKTKLNGTVVYARTVIVSATAGNATASGFALTDALAGVTGSASSPALIKIEPGVYDIGSAVLTMKAYVDIEGSGQNLTFIKTARSSNALSASSAVFNNVVNAELRDLTLSNTGSGSAMVAGYYASNTVALVRGVTVNVSGGTVFSFGIASSNTATNLLTVSDSVVNVTGATTNMGVWAGNALVTVRDSTVNVSNGTTNRAVALEDTAANVTIIGSKLLASGSTGALTGLYVAPGTATVYNSLVWAEGTTTGQMTGVKTSTASNSSVSILHSHIKGLSNAIERGTGSPGSFLKVGASMIQGTAIGAPTCIYSYDVNFLAHNCAQIN